MRLTYCLFVLASALLCLEASALSRPAIAKAFPVFEDSTAKAVVVVSRNVESHQKPAFFARLKSKFTGLFFKNTITAEGKNSTKSTLGWIALGATGLGIILLFAGTGAVGGVLLFGGILTGIVSLIMPRTTEEKAAKKKSNTAAILAIALGLGLIIVIAIALSSWK